MRKHYLIFFLVVSNYSFAQTIITELNFPYHKGYGLEMKGTYKDYDNNGELKDSGVKGMIYNIPHEETVKKETWVVFRVKFFRGTDSTIHNNTFLTQDSKGMTWWTADPATNDFDKHRTQAIKLPLQKGKEWKTYFSDDKVVCHCFATDTIIKTHIGDLPAFGIQTRYVVQKTSEYAMVVYFIEFYNQAIGKIGTIDKTYIEYFGTNKKILISEEEETLSNYTGYKDTN